MPQTIKAPEFKNVVEWINSKNLSLESMNGTVILLNFRSYTDSAFQKLSPFIGALHETYNAYGFTVIGVCVPRFDFERFDFNVSYSVNKEGIDYPVCLDKENDIRKLCNAKSDIAFILIDSEGKINSTYRLEDVALIENKISALLLGARKTRPIEPITEQNRIFDTTNKELLVCGTDGTIANNNSFEKGKELFFGDCTPRVEDKIYLDGWWKEEKEYIIKTTSDIGHIAIKFYGKNLYVIARPAFSYPHCKFTVELDGKNITKENTGKDISFSDHDEGLLSVHKPRLYHVVKTKNAGTHEIRLLTNSKDFMFYGFIFN